MDPFSLAIAAGQAGLSFFGERAKSEQARASRNQQIKIQNKQAKQQRDSQNQQIRDQNAYRMYEYNTKKKLGQQQLGLNADAATQAYYSENLRLQQQFQQAAFQRSGMKRQLLEAAGYNAAMNEGNRGRSFDRASAIGTYGDYGRSMEQMNERGRSMQSQSEANIRRLHQQHRQADMNVHAQTAIMPYMQSQLPAAMQMPLQQGSGFNSMLQIGNAVLGGAMTYGSLAPPAAGNIGQQFGTSNTLKGPTFGGTNSGMTGSFNYSANTAGLSSIGTSGFANPLGFKPF